MNFNQLVLHILLPDGSERTIRLANLAQPTTGFNLLNAPLLVKAEAGAQYKLLNIETGTHQKEQRLLRQNKTLKVFGVSHLRVSIFINQNGNHWPFYCEYSIYFWSTCSLDE